jgi:DNA modification methylase
MTPQVAFNKAYEPCVYGTVGKPSLNKNIRNLNEILNQEVGSGNQVHDEILEMITIWLDKRDNAQEYEHPTQKPITLAEKPLKRCASPGGVILDLFGGSGSTLIACEQIKRSSRLMEQDPIFASVIVNRWEVFTNLKAKKI